MSCCLPDGLRRHGLVEVEAGLVLRDEDRAQEADARALPAQLFAGRPGAGVQLREPAPAVDRAGKLEGVVGEPFDGNDARATALPRQLGRSPDNQPRSDRNAIEYGVMVVLIVVATASRWLPHRDSE